MNLSLFPQGHIYADETNPSAKWIELPILFERVATGPPGIIDVVVRAVDVDGRTLPVLRQPAVCSYNRTEDPDTGAVNLRGQSIGERPVFFRANEEGNNVLLFAFSVELPEAQWEALSETPRFRFELSFIFSTFVQLDVVVYAESSPTTGVLALEKIHRREKATLVLANLIALAIITGLVLYWNLKLNADVYNQENAFSQKAISGFMGVFFTFLGLSLARAKAWIATFTEFVSVLKYPELHLNLTLYRSFSSPFWSAFLVGGFLIVGALIYQNWSVAVPQDPDWQVYDSETGEVVTNSRIYLSALEEKENDLPRFWVVCTFDEGSTEQGSDQVPIRLGYIKSFSGIDSLLYNVAYYKSRNVVKPSGTWTLNAIKWVKRSAMRSEVEPADLAPDIHLALCQPHMAKTPETNRRPLITHTNGQYRLELRDQAVFTKDQIEAWVDDLKETRFERYDKRTLYAERLEHIYAGSQDLAQRIKDSNSILPLSTLQQVTFDFIKQARSGPKQAIERGIQLQALWNAFAGSLDKDPSTEVVSSVTDSVITFLAEKRRWRIERVMFEFLFVLQERTGVEAPVHEAIMALWSRLPKENKASYRHDYLVTGALWGILDSDSPQFYYFSDEWEAMKAEQGDPQLINHLVNREKWERNGQSISGELRRRLQAFEAQIERFAEGPHTRS